MIDVIYKAVALAFDSFIACFALGALVPLRKRAPISMAFGVFDSAAYASGALLSMALPEGFKVGLLKPIGGVALACYGACVLLWALRGQKPKLRGSGWVALPALLSLDNLIAGALPPLDSSVGMVFVTAIASSALAYLGFGASARLAQMAWFPRSQVLRGLIVFSASLLLIVH